jgi:hypothetical protein
MIYRVKSLLNEGDYEYYFLCKEYSISFYLLLITYHSEEIQVTHFIDDIYQKIIKNRN